MPADLTRNPEGRVQGYGPPVMQQGRVILDRDFNALQENLSGSIEADALDIVGPCGTPDNGFEISLDLTSPPETVWSPPTPRSSIQSSGGPNDFYIRAGTMYVGGKRAVFPAGVPGQQAPLAYSYYDQPDWRNPDQPPSSLTSEAISLVLREQEVCAVEDPDLLDVALGGPDTTQRLRLMRRIERTAGGDCYGAAAAWQKRGFKFDPKTMRLAPQVQLQVTLADGQSSGPCDPVAAGGYLGAYNQLLRVQVRQVNKKPTLIWGYDNASYLYRVSTSDNVVLNLAEDPVDVFHQPVAGQVVEILRTTAILGSYTDETVTDQTSTVLRCVAESLGFITTLQTGFTQGQNGQLSTITLKDKLPGEFTGDPQLFLRVWESQTAGLTSNTPIPLIDSAQQNTGLQVTVTLPGGVTEFPQGAFWMIAVRPETPQAVYPERFLAAPQPPDGPRMWLCPLAVIDWTSSPPSVSDCRSKFCNLVDLSGRRRASCCTFRVGDGVNTFGDFTSIQKAINNLPSQGGEICILPGRYFERITIDGLSDVVIHGCGAETRIASPSLNPNSSGNNASSMANAGGSGGSTTPSGSAVISIQNSTNQSSYNIELRSFVVEADAGDIGILVGPLGGLLAIEALYLNFSGDGSPGFDADRLKGAEMIKDVTMTDLIVLGSDQSAVIMTGNALRLADSTIAMQPFENEYPAVYAAGVGLEIAGNWVGLLSSAVLPQIVLSDLESDETQANPSTATNAEISGMILTRGGIQIGGLSKNVCIVDNQINGGTGNGISLGSLITLDASGNPSGISIGWINSGGTSQGICSPGSIIITGGSTSGPPVALSGPLVEIDIERNCIENMELAGIGPVGFFELETDPEAVVVGELSIVQNKISGCFSSSVAALEGSTSSYMAYGAISLPLVEVVIIRDNLIENAGVSLADPICGIYALWGLQVEISRNQITDSRDDETTDEISEGRTGILMFVTPALDTSSSSLTVMAGQQALSLFDNFVNVPAGSALGLLGVGAFSVRGNQFITSGLSGDTVGILNFGAPLEIQSLLGAVLYWVSAISSRDPSESLCAYAKDEEDTSWIFQGPVLFSQNRVWAEVAGQAPGAVIASVFILTLDDLGFSDNQCGLVCGERQVGYNALLMAPTLRVTGNRFQEPCGAVIRSALTISPENLTALNVSSNRIASLQASSPVGVNKANY